jgi:hypothetical protein
MDTELIADTFAHAASRAAQPVRVPWRIPLFAFAIGFSAALVPSFLLTLPFAGRVTALATLLTSTAVGLAVSVLITAREYDDA